MFDWFKRLVCKHKWVYGKAAPKEAQVLGWAYYHNRACMKCSKTDLAADRAEAEMARLAELQDTIGADRPTGTGDVQDLARKRLDE